MKIKAPFDLVTYSQYYLLDWALSYSDICLIPQVYNANRFGVDMEQFPKIQRIMNNLGPDQLETQNCYQVAFLYHKYIKKSQK